MERHTRRKMHLTSSPLTLLILLRRRTTDTGVVGAALSSLRHAAPSSRPVPPVSVVALIVDGVSLADADDTAVNNIACGHALAKAPSAPLLRLECLLN